MRTGTVITIAAATIPVLLSAPATRATANPESSAIKDIIAAQLRRQDYACDRAVSAERDGNASRPGSAVWRLECNNASYTVRLTPNQRADVERLSTP